MTNGKFEILMQNVRNMPACDLMERKQQLYDVTFGMTETQLKQFAETLLKKGVAYREYGNVFINGIRECIF